MQELPEGYIARTDDEYLKNGPLVGELRLYDHALVHMVGVLVRTQGEDILKSDTNLELIIETAEVLAERIVKSHHWPRVTDEDIGGS